MLIVPGEDHNLHIAHQVFQVQESHHLVVLGVFDGLVRDQPAHHDIGLVRHPRGPSLLVQREIVGGVGDVFLPQLLVGLQRMAAYIDAQHLFLEGQQHLLRILSHIRQADIELLLLRVVRDVEQGNLPRQIALPVLGDMVHHLHVDAHELFPGPAQPVQRPGLDEILHGPLVHILILGTHQEILQVGERPPGLALCHDIVDGRPSDSLDGGQGVADASAVYGEPALSLVDVGRQQLDAHIPAGQDVLGHLLGIVDDGGHQGRHEFHGIIELQPGRLVGHHCVAGRVGLVEGIFSEVSHVVKYAAGHLLADAS